MNYFSYFVANLYRILRSVQLKITSDSLKMVFKKKTLN